MNGLRAYFGDLHNHWERQGENPVAFETRTARNENTRSDSAWKIAFEIKGDGARADGSPGKRSAPHQ